MNRILESVVLCFGMFLILLGVVFLIAGGMDNIVTGAVLVVVAAILLLFVYRSQKIEATKPTLVSQTFNVKMEGTGQTEQKELKCRNCGAPLSEKDLTVVEGAVMMKCPYCATVAKFEEAPKW
ncbi:MAG: hypothetical protein WC375_10380 [Methanomassiliicoccales archaeon]